MLVEQFKQWLENAVPGEEYPYHSGFLSNDRFDDSAGERPNGISDLADAIYKASADGEVSLYQIRLYPEYRGFEYIARKCPLADKLRDLERMKGVPWTPAVLPVYPQVVVEQATEK